MYTLKDNEKTTPAMFYTHDALFHGDVITAEMARVNIGLRSESAPKYIHMLSAQMISLNGNGRIMPFNEVFIPTAEIIA